MQTIESSVLGTWVREPSFNLDTGATQGGRQIKQNQKGGTPCQIAPIPSDVLGQNRIGRAKRPKICPAHSALRTSTPHLAPFFAVAAFFSQQGALLLVVPHNLL